MFRVADPAYLRTLFAAETQTRVRTRHHYRARIIAWRSIADFETAQTALGMGTLVYAGFDTWCANFATVLRADRVQAADLALFHTGRAILDIRADVLAGVITDQNLLADVATSIVQLNSFAFFEFVARRALISAFVFAGQSTRTFLVTLVRFEENVELLPAGSFCEMPALGLVVDGVLARPDKAPLHLSRGDGRAVLETLAHARMATLNSLSAVLKAIYGLWIVEGFLTLELEGVLANRMGVVNDFRTLPIGEIAF